MQRGVLGHPSEPLGVGGEWRLDHLLNELECCAGDEHNGGSDPANGKRRAGRLRTRTEGVVLVKTDVTIGGSCSEVDDAATFDQKLARTHGSVVPSRQQDICTRKLSDAQLQLEVPSGPSGLTIHRYLALAPGLQYRIHDAPTLLAASPRTESSGSPSSTPARTSPSASSQRDLGWLSGHGRYEGALARKESRADATAYRSYDRGMSPAAGGG
jgi:hypothetical protein